LSFLLKAQKISCLNLKTSFLKTYPDTKEPVKTQKLSETSSYRFKYALVCIVVDPRFKRNIYSMVSSLMNTDVSIVSTAREEISVPYKKSQRNRNILTKVVTEKKSMPENYFGRTSLILKATPSTCFRCIKCCVKENENEQKWNLPVE